MTVAAPLETGVALARLRLPAKFHQIGHMAIVLYLAHALAFFLTPALVAFAIVDDLPASIYAQVALALALGLIGGHGMHLLTFVGHEGMHTNLHRNKYVSAAVAVVFTSVVPFFFIIGFAMTHWKHHRFTGQGLDPDVQIYSQYRNFVSRFFLARSASVRVYIKNALGMALGRELPENTKLPFTDRELRWIARSNVALGMVALAGYAFIWQRSLWLGFTVMLIPYITLYVLSSMRAYIEHTGTAPGRYVDSRSYTSPVYTALFFGSNFHLEHHQYPAVPCYRLPELHRYLKERGVLDGTGVQVERSFVGALRYTTSRFQYPCVDSPSAPDEFIEQIAGGHLDRQADVAGSPADEPAPAFANVKAPA